MSYSHYGKRLAPIIRKIENMENQNPSVINQQITFLIRAKQVALEEKRWDAYIVVINRILYLCAEFCAQAGEGISYCSEFLRFVKNYSDKAIEQAYDQTDVAFLTTSTFSYVVDIYSEYPQINDEQIDHLFNVFWDTIRKFGDDFYYWQSRLRIAIHRKDKKETAKALELYIKLRHPWNCYACESLRIEKAYLMLGEIDKALEVFDDIISDQYSQEDAENYRSCTNAMLHERNRDLLLSSIMLGLCDLFRSYALATHETLPLGEPTNQMDLVVSAYLGNFENSESELLYLRDFENKQLSPFKKMLDALCIWGYLKGMQRYGMNTMELSWTKPVFEGADSNECPVDNAIDYFEHIADEIGYQFDNSRKAFDYEELKNTFKILSNGQCK